MFGKKKNNEVVEENFNEDEFELNEDEVEEAKDDVVITDDAPDLEDEASVKEKIKEIKKEEKKRKKEEVKEEIAQKDEILNPKSKTKIGQTFKMYKFIIKIVIFAMLLTFGILMVIYKDELIGAVYLVSGIIITFSALIRIIPLLRTSRTKRARLLMIIQIAIHLAIGCYLILAAFYHWAKLNDIAQAIADGNSQLANKSLNEQLNEVSGGNFAKFNIVAYSYILIIFLYTLAVGYYWLTILYDEPTGKTLFWLNTISISACVLLAIFADKLDAGTLVLTLAVLSIIASVVIAGEAGGGYFRYRKALSASKPKEKTKAKEKGKEAPSKKKEDYTEIDPTIIPVEEPQDDATIVS